MKLDLPDEFAPATTLSAASGIVRRSLMDLKPWMLIAAKLWPNLSVLVREIFFAAGFLVLINMLLGD
jgi:hypothetical protein